MRFLTALVLLLSASVGLTAEWDLDTNFGSAGRQVVNFDAGGANTDRIVKLLRYPDTLGGKYVAVGSATLPNGNLGIAVARLNADGSPDVSFGTNGRVLKDACLSAVSHAAFDSFYRIIVVGTTTSACTGNGTTDVGVVRFTAFGADDLSFAGDGGLGLKFRPSFDVDDFGGAVLVLSDDSLLVGGNAGTSAYVQRVSVNGVASVLSPAQTNAGAFARKIVDVQLGQANSSFWLISEVGQTLNVPGSIWKLNNGTLGNDTGFDSTGEKLIVVTSNAGTFASCGQGAEHRVASLVRFGTRIYSFGFTTTGYSFMSGVGENDGTQRVYRCLESGSTPVNFTALATSSSSDAGGSIYLAGSRGAPENFSLWRVVRADASSTSFIPDVSFNSGVPVTVSFPASSASTPQSNAFSLVRHGNQSALAGLRVWNLASGDFDFALARFGTDIFKSGFEN